VFDQKKSWIAGIAVATALTPAQPWAAEPNPFAPDAPSPVAPKPLSTGELKVFKAPETSYPVLPSPLSQAAPTVETPVQKSVKVAPTPIHPDMKTGSPVTSEAALDAASDTESGRLDSLQNVFTSEESDEDSERLDAPQPKTSEQPPAPQPIVENIEIPQISPEVQTAKQDHVENAEQHLKLEAKTETVVAPEIPNPAQTEMSENTVKEVQARPAAPEENELDQNRPADTANAKRNTRPMNALVEKSPSYLQLDQMRSPKTQQGFFDRLAEMLTPETKPKTSAAKVSIDIPEKKSAPPPEKPSLQIAEQTPDKPVTIQAMEDESAAPVDLIKIDEERPTVSSALESPTDEPAKASDQQKVPEMRIVEEALSDKTPLKELAPEIPEAATIDPMPKPVAVEAQPLDPALSETVKTVEAAPPPKPMEPLTPEPAVTSLPPPSEISQPRPTAQIAEKIEPLEPVPEAAIPVETSNIPAPPKALVEAAKPPAPVPEGITPVDPKALDAGEEIAFSTKNVSEQPAFTTLNKTPETPIAETPQEDENIGLFGRLTRLFSDDRAKSDSQSNERRIVVEAQDPPSENNTMDAVQVAAVQPEAQLPPPRDATFKTETWGLGDNVKLTQLEPTQDGKHIPCFDKSFLARTHCVVDVNWPANLKKVFNGGGVLYNGTKAIVAYDQGRATRLYTLFESNSYEAVVAHFQKKLGPPHFRSIRKIRVLQGPRLANDFVVWHMGKSSSNDGPVTVEIRRYDDVRQTFPDTNSGLVRVYFDHTIPLFKRVSPLDFLSLR